MTRTKNFIVSAAILACSSSILYIIRTELSHISIVPNIMERPLLDDTATAISTSHRSSNRASTTAASYFNVSLLEEYIERNIEFHQRGGNLKSVQLLKDNSIHSTLENHGVKFYPTGASPEEGTHELLPALKKYYDANYDPRGGYGKPLPGKFDDSKILMEKRWFEVEEPLRGREKWDAALGPIGPMCDNLAEIGGKNKDGHKYMCVPRKSKNENDETTTATTTTQLSDNDDDCHIISVGGNDNWLFEEDVVQQMPGCITHTFDCTLPGGIPKKKPQRDDVKFYNYCMAGTSYNDPHGRQYLSYADAVHMAGIPKAPVYFKIDVEGFEYDIFTNMVHKPEILPLQIAVELHWATRMTGVEWMPRIRSSGELALFSSTMFTTGGYLPILTEDILPWCPSCMEVLYFRARA